MEFNSGFKGLNNLVLSVLSGGGGGEEVMGP